MSKPRSEMKYLNVNRYLLNKQSDVSQNSQELQDEMWLVVLFSEFVHDLPLELPKELKQVSLSSSKSESLIKKLCKSF